MRELKFRAWSIDGGKWCSRVDYDGYEEKWTGIVEVNSPIEKDKYIGEYAADPEKIIIEQYTGLKDKNGKEIYEGDIVEEKINTGDYDIDGTYRYKVVWDEDMLCWSLDPNGTSIHKDLWECNHSLKVIGNVHENKELLK